MKSVLLTVWTVVQVIVWSIVFAVPAFLGSLVERRGYAAHFCARLWAHMILFCSGVRVQIMGRENLDPDGAYVFMSNHESALDIPILIRSLPFQVRMMAKKELFRIPIFGWALALGGYIKVDRTNTERAIASLREAARRIPRQGVSVVVFPEGTRSPTGRLRRFKKGGFAFAMDTGYPVVPVTIRGSRARIPKGALAIRPGRVEVIIDPPIPTEPYNRETRSQLVETTRDIILEHKESEAAQTE